MTKINITREQIEELYVVKRLSIKRTAFTLGIYVDTLKRRMKEYGIESRSKCYRSDGCASYNRDIQRCASARARDIMRMVDEGWNYGQIAKRENVTRQRIYQIVRKYKRDTLTSNQPTTAREECNA
jgi:transcriptional regulator of acetoin/glycerol metabolism